MKDTSLLHMCQFTYEFRRTFQHEVERSNESLKRIDFKRATSTREKGNCSLAQASKGMIDTCSSKNYNNSNKFTYSVLTRTIVFSFRIKRETRFLWKQRQPHLSRTIVTLTFFAVALCMVHATRTNRQFTARRENGYEKPI